MARSTGPILAVGTITVVNNVIVNGKPMDWRIPVMTAIAAGGFALAEKGWEEGAVALSYMALIAVLFARIDPKVPSPVESFLDWIKK